MKNIPFIKMHGLGNDFVIVDERSVDYSFTAEMVQRISNRREGVGCDQFVVLAKSKKDNCDCFVRFYNADGSESGACGNASRCVAWLLMEEFSKEKVVLETMSGQLVCKKTGENAVCVNMGKAKNDWKNIPLAYETDTLHLAIEQGDLKDPVAVSVGNPHVVFFVENVAEVNLEKEGSILENHDIFPDRANIGIVQIVSESEIILRVWERGTGETRACGTGACAAVVAAGRRGLVGDNVVVHLTGGDLQIEICDDNIIMTGPVVVSFSGNIK